MIRRRPPRTPSPRKGQLLMEFAFIALILYLLLAGIIDFGRAMFAAQVMQQAVDASARELSRTPMPPTGTLTGPAGMFATNTAAQQIYQPQYLVVAPGQLAAGQSLADFFADKPLLNRLLMPLMIWNAEQQVWQYPGQIGPDTAGLRIPGDDPHCPVQRGRHGSDHPKHPCRRRDQRQPGRRPFDPGPERQPVQPPGRERAAVAAGLHRPARELPVPGGGADFVPGQTGRHGPAR